MSCPSPSVTRATCIAAVISAVIALYFVAIYFKTPMWDWLHERIHPSSDAVTTQEYLTPCHKGFLSDYTHDVDVIARNAMPGRLKLSVIVIPSFRPEWGVGVTIQRGVTYLTYVVFDHSLWHRVSAETSNTLHGNNLPAEPVKPIARTTRISGGLSAALLAEWQRSIRAARPSPSLGTDGATFRFNLPNGQCASAWSPSPHTRNRKLVNIVLALRDLAGKDKDANPAQTHALINALRDLGHP